MDGSIDRHNAMRNGNTGNQTHQSSAMAQNEAMSMMSNMFNPMMAAFIQQLAAQTQSMQSQHSPNSSVAYTTPPMMDSTSSTNLGSVTSSTQAQWNHHAHHHHQLPIGVNASFNGVGVVQQSQHTRFKSDKKY